MIRPHRLRTSLALAFVVLLPGCTREAPKSSAPPEKYQVRGLVRQLPEPGPGAAELLIHHEAVPGFKDDQGEVVGMDAMAMSFPLADPGLAQGVAVGDKIDFEFVVDWHGSPALSVTRIEKLPEATELEFGKKSSGAGSETRGS